MTCKHSNAFQYSELNRIVMRYQVLDSKEALHWPCPCQHHRDILVLHAVVLDLASKCWRKMWLFECLAVVRCTPSLSGFLTQNTLFLHIKERSAYFFSIYRSIYVDVFVYNSETCWFDYWKKTIAHCLNLSLHICQLAVVDPIEILKEFLSACRLYASLQVFVEVMGSTNCEINLKLWWFNVRKIR